MIVLLIRKLFFGFRIFEGELEIMYALGHVGSCGTDPIPWHEEDPPGGGGIRPWLYHFEKFTIRFDFGCLERNTRGCWRRDDGGGW